MVAISRKPRNLRRRISGGNKKRVEKTVQGTHDRGLEGKQKELESIVNPTTQEVYQASVGSGKLELEPDGLAGPAGGRGEDNEELTLDQ